MKNLRLLLPAFVLVLSSAVLAQDAEKFSRNQAIQISSAFLEENRQISIYLPGDYAHSLTKYPVLYLLDGGTHLQHASAAADYHSGPGTIPDIIVVAVHNIDRTRDLSPVHVERFPTSGGAENFLEFLSKELVPYMDKNYRTAGFNILLGHSLGGTFIAYTLLEKPELFDAFLAVSPYLMYADKLMVKKTSEELKPFKDTKYFYMTVGKEEPYFEPLGEYASVMKEKAGESVQFRYVKMLEENHATTPYISVFKGLRFIFRGWQLPVEMLQSDLESIDNHFKSNSKKYGIDVATPEQVINALGYRYLQAKHYEMAIATFQENVNRYPKSANVYDSLGEAYENHGKTEMAANHYQKAVRLGEKNSDPNLSVYKTNLERVSEK